MHKSVTLLAAVALAGAAFAGVSAFTAGNTMPTSDGVTGYGEVVATGATITSVTTTPLGSDASRLDKVTFVSSTDVHDKTVTMTLKSGSTVVGSPYICNAGSFDGTSETIVCSAAPTNPLINTYDTTGLTVVSP
jgi:hypothetical protein